mmetsp:Transcript_16027/g.46368  ORF Transcript_16027/g.46368 Transcript_16027/m.46368 type:complete len:251 (-) Transcript_16027:633-1385(-)
MPKASASTAYPAELLETAPKPRPSGEALPPRRPWLLWLPRGLGSEERRGSCPRPSSSPALSGSSAALCESLDPNDEREEPSSPKCLKSPMVLKRSTTFGDNFLADDGWLLVGLILEALRSFARRLELPALHVGEASRLRLRVCGLRGPGSLGFLPKVGLNPDAAFKRGGDDKNALGDSFTPFFLGDVELPIPAVGVRARRIGTGESDSAAGAVRALRGILMIELLAASFDAGDSSGARENASPSSSVRLA